MDCAETSQIKVTLNRLYNQAEELLQENEQLIPECRIPLESFALNQKSLEALAEQLRKNEEKVAKQVERDRLKKQLECFSLLDYAWHRYRTKAATVMAFDGTFGAKNYPILTTQPSEICLETLRNRLIELKVLEENTKMDDVWKVWRNLPQSPSAILYSQLQLSNSDIVKKQIQLLSVLQTRLADSFNDKLACLKDKKVTMLNKIKQLIQQRIQLKQELIAEDLKNEKTEDALRQSEEDADDLLLPQLIPEEEPEKLLYVEDKEVQEPGNLQESQLVNGTKSRTDQESIGHVRAKMYEISFDSPVPWLEAHKKRSEEAQSLKQSQAKDAKLKRIRLQVKRICPTIKNLKDEFAREVMTLSEERIKTDQEIFLAQIMSSRLQKRLYAEDDLLKTFETITNKHINLEAKAEELLDEINKLRRTQVKENSRKETLIASLKEEDTQAQRTFVNLPVNQYRRLLYIYRLRPQSGSKSQTAEAQATESCETGEIKEAPLRMAVGSRVWKSFQRFRSRRHALFDELADATAQKNLATSQLTLKLEEKEVLSQKIYETEDEMEMMKQQLRILNESVEIVIEIPKRNFRLNMESMVHKLDPDFTDVKLLHREELCALEQAAELKIIGDEFVPFEVAQTKSKSKKEQPTKSAESDVQGDGSTKNELEELVRERDRLLLQVELAQERLKQISQIKVSKEILQVHGTTSDSPIDQDTSQQHDYLIKLQDLQAREVHLQAEQLHKYNNKIQATHTRISKLQEQTDKIVIEVEDLQNQLSDESTQDEMSSRLNEIMLARRLADISKGKEEELKKAEQELQRLRKRTYPMLPHGKTYRN